MMRDLVEFYGTLNHEGRGTASGFLHVPALALCISYFCISVATVSDRNNLKQQHFVLAHSVRVLQSIVVEKTWQQGHSAHSRQAGACGRVCLHHRDQEHQEQLRDQELGAAFKGWLLHSTSISQIPPSKNLRTSQSRDWVWRALQSPTISPLSIDWSG